MTTLANDGLSPARGAPGGGEIWSGTVNFDGSSATTFSVNVTSSDVLKRPAMEIGPTLKADIVTFAVAFTSSLPPATVASPCHETGSVVFFTVSMPVNPNG